MKPVIKTTLRRAFLTALLFAAFTASGPLSIHLISDAHAIIGLPFTPLSIAGVARRTAFRTAVWSGALANQTAAAQAAYYQPPVAPPPPATATGTLPIGTVVHTLPAGCTSTPVEGVDYYYCSGNFYRAAFSGNNLVYVTAKP
ncbi:MAG: hypothetical protein WBM71_06230 [Sedimenticolaceae bacterium]|jgi:hypothetical protein